MGKLTAALEAAAKQTERLTAQKNTAQEGGEVRYSLNEDFGRQFDKWMEETDEIGRKVDGSYFRIGTTSDVLKGIGVMDGNIYWRKQKIGYIMSDHLEIDADTVKSVPDMIEHPVIVMKSLTREDSIVLMGDLIASDGRHVMASMGLTPKMSGSMEANFSLITSTYGRSKENMQHLVNTSEILFLDPDKKEPRPG